MNQTANLSTLQEVVPTREVSNLIDEVTSAFVEAGHPRPEAWKGYLHPDALTTPDLSIQRFLINRALRLIVGLVTSENTMDVRFCLVDNGEFIDWVRLFRIEVLPCLMRNQVLFAVH